MEGPHKAANTQQNSALNINQPRQHNNAYERQANQQKFNKFLDLYLWLSYKTFVLYSQKKKPERLSCCIGSSAAIRPRQATKERSIISARTHCVNSAS